MISWVNNKNVDISKVNDKINSCIQTKHMTNGGVNVKKLEQELKTIFKLDSDKETLLVCNGASGLYALVGGMNIHYNKKLKWVVQAFTFPCSNQGLLIDSIIMDIDKNMGPNIIELNERKDEYDGILITNCFGCSVNIKLYEDFCKEHNKLLLFDNAAASMTFYNNINHLNNGNGCMVSLHHTKPIGFGEGGFIVFDKKYLESMKKAICFGFTDTNKLEYNMYASNYKMSEIACVYIAEYLKNVDKIYNYHTKHISYFLDKMPDSVTIVKSYSPYDVSLMSTIPILFNKKVSTDKFTENGIEAKKYYYPLDFNCKNSVDLFNRIICLPLNMDVTEKIIDRYIEIINCL